jgi:pimeloyl-ACP methyl ester carboxylesterase
MTTTDTTPTRPPTADPASVEEREVAAAGTTFAVDIRGEGDPVLVIHGGGEDRTMLAPFAEALAGHGRRVVTYDRRGTGGSGREDWPGNGADQHADDAAALLDALDIPSADVVGLSSGGVIALSMAARHPRSVSHAFVWEAPALGMVPGGEAINAQFMAPVEAHLAEHPGDYVGAQAILLTTILGFPVSIDDPLFAAARANAEPMIRDDTSIPLRPFTAEELAGLPITIAEGSAPNEAGAAATAALSGLIGQDPLVIDTPDHEVYLLDPAFFAEVVTSDR